MAYLRIYHDSKFILFEDSRTLGELLMQTIKLINSNSYLQDFPGGPVVKNPPANARNVGLIPGLGRFHMPRKAKPTNFRDHVLQLEKTQCSQK